MFQFFLNSFFTKIGLIVIPSAFFIKIYFTNFLLRKKSRLASSAHYAWLFMVIVLLAQMTGELIWTISLTDNLFLTSYFTFTWKSIGYIAFIFLYVSLVLFLKELSQKFILFPFLDKLLLIPPFGFILYFFSLIFTKDILPLGSSLEDIKFFTGCYIVTLLTLYSLTILLSKPESSQPKILNYQLNIFVKFFILTLISVDIPVIFKNFLYIHPTIITFLATFSSIFTTIALTYCLKKVMGFRFLNVAKAVSSKMKEAKKETVFANSFANLLKNLGTARSDEDIYEAIRDFCSLALAIPKKKIFFYMYSLEYEEDEDIRKKKLEIIKRYFPFSPLLNDTMRIEKVLVYDEVVFSYYYEGTIAQEKSISFLTAIEADIYLPIYYQDQKVACVIIKKNSLKKDELYTKTHQDELTMFATYIGYIYNVLQTTGLEVLLSKKHKLENDLHVKNIEVKNYKESIKTFMLDPSQSKIGVLAYKNKKFAQATKRTQEIVGTEINKKKDSHFIKSLYRILETVKKTKSDVADFSKDVKGKIVIIHAAHQAKENNFLFLLYYPGVIDIIKQRIQFLKNPTEWDYLLYLECTKAGKIIETHFPSSNALMLNFKVDLLKASLEKRTVWLQLHVDDLSTIVEILHKMSLRKYLKTISLNSNSHAEEFTSQLFGSHAIVNPIPVQKCFLKKLDHEGSLYIHNIHYLSLEDQDKLTEYLQQGHFTPHRSKEKHGADVRIIVSSDENLKTLEKEGQFSTKLFNELKKITIALPSLVYVSDQELLEFMEDINYKEINSHPHAKRLELTQEDKYNVLKAKPASWKQLEVHIKSLIRQKTKKYKLDTFNASRSHSTDPILYQAEQLGKETLKNQKLMSELWKKFNKNQLQMALFLGVNRSSVSRRCKEYGLMS